MAGELSDLAKTFVQKTGTAPFAPTGVDHVVLLVGEMERALEFYIRVLGCVPGYSYPEIAMEQAWAGAQLIVLIDLDDPRSKYAQPAKAGGRNMDHLCVSISPCSREDLRAYLGAHNVEIEHEAFHGGAHGMGEATYIVDPWGNKIELKGPAQI